MEMDIASPEPDEGQQLKNESAESSVWGTGGIFKEEEEEEDFESFRKRRRTQSRTALSPLFSLVNF
jgi:hypothetical protein